MKKESSNFVIFRTDRIGEVLLASAAVSGIKNACPGSKVTFVTSEYSRPVVEGVPGIDRIWTVDTAKKGNYILRVLALARKLGKSNFDAAIILNPHKMLHLACFLAGIHVRAGYARKWGLFLNKTIPDKRDAGEKHGVEYTMDLLRVVGADMADPEIKLTIDVASERSIEDYMRQKGLDGGRPLVILHPGSSNSAKLWPGDKYTSLLGRLRSECDISLAVIGDKNEKALVGEVIERSGTDAVNCAGDFDLKTMIAFVSKASLFIGNDTGPMHIAAALGVPVIAVFGRNIPGVSPRRWGPRGNGHVVFHEAGDCEICYDDKCPFEYKCLNNITVDMVFEAAKGMLNRSDPDMNNK